MLQVLVNGKAPGMLESKFQETTMYRFPEVMVLMNCKNPDILENKFQERRTTKRFPEVNGFNEW